MQADVGPLRGQVMAELVRPLHRVIAKGLGSALLLITHDLAMAARWCERMAMLDGGRKVDDGPSRQLLRAPRSGRMWEQRPQFRRPSSAGRRTAQEGWIAVPRAQIRHG